MTKLDNSVSGALTGRSPVVVTAEQTVREAAAVLRDHEIGAAPVLAENRLIGIFTERDILQRVVASGRDANTMRVSEAMTPDPCTVSADTSLVEALSLMIEGKFRHLPVVKDGAVIGVLSMRDIPLHNQIMHHQWTTWTKGKVAASGPHQGDGTKEA
jgi:CBS domain-containing protein